jgi:hypothetical protein
MTSISWLDYFTDEVTDVIIKMSHKPYVKKRASNVNGANVAGGEQYLYEDASPKVVTKGDFYSELSKVLKTNEHWNQFFTNYGIGFTLNHEGKKYRFLAVGYEGIKETPSVSIKRV